MSIILSENETNSVFACSGRQSYIIVVMKRNTFEKRMAGAVLVAAALLLMVDWSPKMGETTRIVGQFAKDTPEAVRIITRDVLDTTVKVTGGRFEVEIPTVLTRIRLRPHL